MTESEICPVCKNPKVENSQGSFTQWIQACSCDGKPSSIEDQIDISEPKLCDDCGKRVVDGRVGSITQFIFRADACQCKNPSLADTKDELSGSISDDQNQIPVQLPEEEVKYPEKIGDFPYERYIPLSKLGQGASSNVYLAKDKLLDKQVAVKLLHSLEGNQLIAFHKEAKATSKLSHPSIVKVMDFGSSDSGTPYMVLEHVPGVSMQEMLKQYGAWSWEFCVEIFSQILEAISYAHQNNVFHRDLKPSNILLIESPNKKTLVKIIDFGLAKALDEEDKKKNSGAIQGTPIYMCPDQAKGLNFDSTSELYSIGCILFECLSGAPPYTGNTSLELLKNHADAEIPKVDLSNSSDLSEKVNTLLAKALAKEKEKRFSSAMEFHRALTELESADEKVEIPTQTKSPKLRANFSIILLISIATATTLILSLGLLDKQAAREQPPASAKIADAGPTKGQEEIINTVSKIDPALETPLWMKTRNLVKGFSVTDQSFNELPKRFPKMKVLRVMAPSEVTGTGLLYIKKKRALTSISISSKLFNEEGGEALTKFPRLRDLKINFSENLNSNFFNSINKIDKLRTLELRGTNPLPQDALAILSKNKTIVALNLAGCKPLSGEQLLSLKSMPKLRSLKLASTELDDSAIDSLLKLNLGDLSIKDTKISNLGLLKLAKGSNLRTISVSFSKNYITPIGVRKFISKAPECNVHVFDQKGRLVSLDNPVYKPVDKALEDLKTRELELLNLD